MSTAVFKIAKEMCDTQRFGDRHGRPPGDLRCVAGPLHHPLQLLIIRLPAAEQGKVFEFDNVRYRHEVWEARISQHLIRGFRRCVGAGKKGEGRASVPFGSFCEYGYRRCVVIGGDMFLERLFDGSEAHHLACDLNEALEAAGDDKGAVFESSDIS